MRSQALGRRHDVWFLIIAAAVLLVVSAAPAALAVPLRMPAIGVAPSGYMVISSLCGSGRPATLKDRLIRTTGE